MRKDQTRFKYSAPVAPLKLPVVWCKPLRVARFLTLNKIAREGISLLESRGHVVGEDVNDPDAILVRSASLHETEFGPSLKAIARAGAGVNNIPVERCTERGIVVFNTPGSNANSVKELVIGGLILSSRRIVDGISWARSIEAADGSLNEKVESGKKHYAGPEISGKTMGVVGLGAIGVMVANAAEALGMEVIGCDPYLSIESAWGLSRSVRRAETVEALFATADYVSLHAPLNDQTRGMVDAALLKRAKRGVRLLNFARGGLVTDDAVREALQDGTISCYVTDFPSETLLGLENVLPIPHLGASTPEAETNSAVMAAKQLADYLERGNVVNGVNTPDCSMEPGSGDRLVLANRNVPNMVGQITTILAEAQLNISDMLNRHRGDLAYNIIDLDGDVADEVIDQIKSVDGVLMARRLRFD